MMTKKYEHDTNYLGFPYVGGIRSRPRTAVSLNDNADRGGPLRESAR